MLHTLRAMERMSCRDGSLAEGRWDRFGRLRWKGFGFVAPNRIIRAGGWVDELIGWVGGCRLGCWMRRSRVRCEMMHLEDDAFRGCL